MIYRDHEILARVSGTYSDLYSIHEDGSLFEESEDLILYNGDEEVIWYEVEVIDPKHGYTTWAMELKSVEAAKELIDESIEWCKENLRDYE